MSSSIPGIGFAYPQALRPAPGPGLAEGGPDFSGVLKNTLQQVNQLETGAHQQVANMLMGGGGDVSSVMIAVEKADVAFQLMMQVRNKIVSAYQSIEQMQF